jgi:hypothetical protein
MKERPPFSGFSVFPRNAPPNPKTTPSLFTFVNLGYNLYCFSMFKLPRILAPLEPEPGFEASAYFKGEPSHGCCYSGVSAG